MNENLVFFVVQFQLSRKERQFYCEESIRISASNEDSEAEVETEEVADLDDEDECQVLDKEDEIVMEGEPEVSYFLNKNITKISGIF